MQVKHTQNTPSASKHTTTLPSNIIYYKVIDEKCDSKETLLSIINNLYTEFIDAYCQSRQSMGM